MKQVWLKRLAIDVSQVEGFPCIRIEGEGEPHGAKLLEQTFEELLENQHTHVIVDTREVRFLDPSCFLAIQSAADRLDGEGGCLVLVDQCLPVERALKLLGLDKIAHVMPTVSQACSYLGSHR